MVGRQRKRLDLAHDREQPASRAEDRKIPITNKNHFRPDSQAKLNTEHKNWLGYRAFAYSASAFRALSFNIRVAAYSVRPANITSVGSRT